MAKEEETSREQHSNELTRWWDRKRSNSRLTKEPGTKKKEEETGERVAEREGSDRKGKINREGERQRQRERERE